MVRILLNGCNGKMGHAVTRACEMKDELFIAAG
ncbi:MAG TPA: 4-hydroxy-tetrahydrodipicolinate reductase, partial [Ruminiclostridium sp.]|nr:4-hydroxy-tetrahydrodipicolinate reductase [Ruminiclostridium sp.]